MAKKRTPKFDLETLRQITVGPEAKGRRAHNQARPQPGEIRTAQAPPPERDRLDRALSKSYDASVSQKELAAKGKPRPGEILSAKTEPPDEEVKREQVRKFLQLAQERFKLAAEATAHSRAEALDDLEFRIGKQWPADIEKQRTIDGRPCLTMNRLPQFIRQVTNEQRQQRPAIQVNPVGDGADTDTAEVIQGIIRHIEVNSDAEVAYDTAFEQCVTSGFGYWRVLTDYIDDRSNDQEILIKRIKNPFSVYVDPAAIEPDESDARYKFIVEDVPLSEYKARYKDTQAATLADFSSVGDDAPEWASKESIRVAEYFYIEESEQEQTEEQLSTRPRIKREVKWAKINAVEIIDGNDDKTEGRTLPGKYIGVIPVLGDDLEVNGKRHLAGLVRSFKDPQRMYNYWVSAATEMIALAPKAPFVGAEGQFEDHEAEWASANTRNLAKLEYKPISIDGVTVEAPKRQIFEPPIQSINLMTRQADNDMKAVTGIYDASLGEKGPEQSGKAILARQKQGDVATLNYADNLSRAMRHTGRVLIDLIPHIYDAPRVQRIINPDQTVDHVIIHNQQPDVAQQMLSQSINKIYDLGVGRYDVTVSVGPSYQSKRQEAAAAQMALVQSYPEMFPIIGDLLIANFDFPQAKEMAKRLKKGVPPQFQDEEDDSPEAQLQRTQGQMQQLMAQHEQLTQALHQSNEIINTKQVENQAKLQIAQAQEASRVAIVKMQEATKLAVAQMNSSKDAQEGFANRELEQYKIFHNSAHDVALQTHQQTHEASQADLAQKAAAEQAQAGNEATQ